MHSRRLIGTVVGVTFVLAAGISPVAAAKPARPAPPGSSELRLNPERPLTAEEQRRSDEKLAAAAAYITMADRSGAGLVTLACVTPTGGVASAPTTDGPAAIGGSGVGAPTTQACYVPSGKLPVSARDQAFGHYCGPAVGQVISNYAWKMAANANKYSQNTIAGWMGTGGGGTDAFGLAAGLERATAGSPRRPSNFGWAVTELRDADRDGVLGDDLQNAIRAAVSGWKMPVGIAVKPHVAGSTHFLPSWPKAVNSPGHWIAAYGWYSGWTGTSFAKVYYADSSRDEGGGTGLYAVSTLSLAAMIAAHTGRFVW